MLYVSATQRKRTAISGSDMKAIAISKVAEVALDYENVALRVWRHSGIGVGQLLEVRTSKRKGGVGPRPWRTQGTGAQLISMCCSGDAVGGWVKVSAAVTR